jgi:hypothetical protein
MQSIRSPVASAPAWCCSESGGLGNKKHRMKSRILLSASLAIALSSLTANACLVQVRVTCPNDTAASGVEVCIDGVGCNTTDGLGIATIHVPSFDNYTICINPNTLPAGANLSPLCQKLKVVDDAPPVVNFVLGGGYCTTPPPPGPCWLTGGGTIGKAKGVANYSFGGVVYPGCSPNAADGGNWNVVDHATGLHFQGQSIIVDNCSGVPTSSPKVTVNAIDFHGTGIIGGIGGNPDATIQVSFVGRAIDNHDGGAGADMLFLTVTDSSNALIMQVGNSASNPAVISTGNLQIHQTSCN